MIGEPPIDSDPPDPAQPGGEGPTPRRREPARDTAARVCQAALEANRLRLVQIGRETTAQFGESSAFRVLPPDLKSTRALSIGLREIFAEAIGHQPSAETLRVMRDVVMAAAARIALRDGATAAEEDDSGESDVVFEREEGRTSQADMLVALADEAKVEFWHSPGGDLFATTRERGCAENRALGSREFRRWLQLRFYEKSGKAARRESVTEAMGVFEGRAMTGPEHEVFVRLAGYRGNVYLDLADRERRVVEVTPEGWSVTTDAPVRFRRPAGMLPLPVPMSGGSIEALRPLANVPDDDGWILLVGFVLGSLHPRGPFAVLVLLGEAGSAKSTMARIIVALLDPKDAPLRRPPREERDLAIAARHGRVVAFNNLSRIPDYLSDAICSIATDGGSVFRTLYTDEEETRFSERRPVLLNGIADFVARGDLADRSIKLTLSPIPPESRRTEADVLADLERLRPRILGALLDAVVAALRNEPFLTLPQVPRLADFARWVVAAEPSLGWKPGTFLAAYRRAIGASSAAILEDSLVARSIAKLVANKEWNGSATSLLAALSGLATEEERKSKTWPATPRALSGEIRRLAPDLRRVGYTVDDSGRDAKTRRVLWRIEAPSRTGADKDPSDPSHPSEPPGTPGGSAWRAEGSAAGDAPAPPPGASDASQRSVSDPDRGVVGPAVDSHGSPSEASEGAERPGPSPSEAPRCATCGRTSPYEGRHIENCPACGPSCPCVTCAKRPGGDDA